MIDTTQSTTTAINEQLTSKTDFSRAVPPSEGLTSGLIHQMMIAQTDCEVRDLQELYVGIPA